MAITHPSDISGLVHRYRVHDGAWQDSAGTMAAGVGDVIGLISDVVGGNALSLDTTGRKPTLLEDANGWRFASHDGTDDIIQGLFSSALTQPYTVVVVGRIVSSTNRFVHDGGPGGTGGRSVIWNTSGTLGQWAGSGPRNTIPVANNALFVAQAVYEGASSLFRLNETEASGDSSPGTGGLGGLTMGGRYDTGNNADVEWYDTLVYNRALTPTERADLYAYLNDLYSNPAGGGGGEVSGAITNAGQQIAGTAQVVIAGAGSLSNAGQSASASASVEAAASGALTNAGQGASGSADVDVSASGSLANAGQSVQGFIGEVPAQVSGAVTNGGQSLSGSLTTEAALSAVVANGGQQISGSAAVDVAASASIENAGQVIASAASVAVSLTGSLTNAGQTITGRMVNGAVLVPSRITLSLESTHALSLSLESSHVLELSVE